MTDTGIHKYFYEEAWTCLLFVYVLFYSLYIETKNPVKPELKQATKKHKSDGNIHPSQASGSKNPMKTSIRVSHWEAQIRWKHPSESAIEKQESDEGDFHN